MNQEQQKMMCQKAYETWGKSAINKQEDKDIIAMCMEHDYPYTWQVVNEIMLTLMPIPSNAKILPKVIKDSKGTQYGFYVFHKYKDVKGKGDIKYFFIKPEHRRKGYAKNIIQKLQSKFTDIYTDSEEEPYINLVKQLGFKDIGKCDNGVETCFHWSKTPTESKPLIEHQYDTGKPRPLPEPVLVNGQRVTREEHEGLNTQNNPKCALCDKSCENQWGNNGHPLTEGRICNTCNDRVIANRINMTLDTIKGMDEDAPDEPE